MNGDKSPVFEMKKFNFKEKIRILEE